MNTKRIEEIESYLLSHNMADVSKREFNKLTSELSRLTLESRKVKKDCSGHLDGLRFCV